MGLMVSTPVTCAYCLCSKGMVRLRACFVNAILRETKDEMIVLRCRKDGGRKPDIRLRLSFFLQGSQSSDSLLQSLMLVLWRRIMTSATMFYSYRGR